MLTNNKAKKTACFEAVKCHMKSSTRIVGIGSGTTIVYCIEAIKNKIKSDNLKIVACIPTSFQARQLILDGGLPLV